jgi:hypothetical protein
MCVRSPNTKIEVYAPRVSGSGKPPQPLSRADPGGTPMDLMSRRLIKINASTVFWKLR